MVKEPITLDQLFLCRTQLSPLVTAPDEFLEDLFRFFQADNLARFGRLNRKRSCLHCVIVSPKDKSPASNENSPLMQPEAINVAPCSSELEPVATFSLELSGVLRHYNLADLAKLQSHLLCAFALFRRFNPSTRVLAIQFDLAAVYVALPRIRDSFCPLSPHRDEELSSPAANAAMPLIRTPCKSLSKRDVIDLIRLDLTHTHFTMAESQFSSSSTDASPVSAQMAAIKCMVDEHETITTSPGSPRLFGLRSTAFGRWTTLCQWLRGSPLISQLSV
eukprot:g78628.t1